MALTSYLRDKIRQYTKAHAADPDLSDQLQSFADMLGDDAEELLDLDDEDGEIQEWPKYLTDTIDSSGQPLAAGDYVVLPDHGDDEWVTEDQFTVAKFIRLEWYDDAPPDAILDDLGGDGEYTHELDEGTHMWRVDPEHVISVQMFSTNEDGTKVVMKSVLEVKRDTLVKHMMLFGGESVYQCDKGGYPSV